MSICIYVQSRHKLSISISFFCLWHYLHSWCDVKWFCFVIYIELLMILIKIDISFTEQYSYWYKLRVPNEDIDKNYFCISTSRLKLLFGQSHISDIFINRRAYSWDLIFLSFYFINFILSNSFLTLALHMSLKNNLYWLQ